MFLKKKKKARDEAALRSRRQFFLSDHVHDGRDEWPEAKCDEDQRHDKPAKTPDRTVTHIVKQQDPQGEADIKISGSAPGHVVDKRKQQRVHDACGHPRGVQGALDGPAKEQGHYDEREDGCERYRAPGGMAVGYGGPRGGFHAFGNLVLDIRHRLGGQIIEFDDCQALRGLGGRTDLLKKGLPALG